MEYNILNEAKKFLCSYLKEKECEEETTHSWRKGWEFVVQHSLRVESYVVKIIDSGDYNFNNKEIELIRLAAILHDIGRIDSRENHAEVGVNIVQKWLLENPEIAIRISDSEKLLYMIKTHSDKEKKGEDISCKILKDADTLDEIGVLSIFMASNRVDKNSPFFFHELLDRVSNFEVGFCDKKMKILNTEAAKEILKKKKEFINLFVGQLNEELEGTENIKNILK